ncbi:MAG: sugar-binding protein [Gammaproteobacteria bacterium]
MQLSRTTTYLIAAIVPVWSIASAQPVGATLKSFEIPRIDAVSTVDGVLDEEVWQQAAVISDLHQLDPIEYANPSEDTDVYVYYDEDALHIGARLWSSGAETVTANILRQGRFIWTDDQFIVVLDPFNNGRDGYSFRLNPNGVRHDGLYTGPNRAQWDWDGIWQGAATIDENGWTAEMSIPFKTLSLNAENDTWRINFGREMQSKNEAMGWVSRNRSQNPAISGLATGFENLSQGVGLDVVPSLIVRDTKNYVIPGSESEVEPQLDVFYRLTPSLNASLTINTDFSATEVDDRQVNLTRFGLFFPEKRDFFLQDADAFEFGDLGTLFDTQLSRVLDQNARPFFSRRIGLSRSGQPVDLEYGGKLSGRAGPWNIGALAIRQGEFGDVDATDLFVGRVTRNVLTESRLGVIATQGDPLSNLDNSLVGFDFRYLNTRLPNGKTVQAEAWYQQSDTDDQTGDDAAWGLRFQLPSQSGLLARVGIKEVGENFNPALGFINRAGIRDTSVELGWIKRNSDQARIRSFLTRFGLQRVEWLDGGLQQQVIDGRIFSIFNQAGDNLRLIYRQTKEVLREPFTIWDPDPSSGELPITIPVGEYDFVTPTLAIQATGARKLSGSLVLRTGDFYTGKRNNADAQMTWVPTRRFRAFVSYSYNDIDLPQGDFELRLSRVGLDFIFSNTLSWVNLIQYDNDSEVLGLNSRLHWIPEAGREAFIVLNHNLEDRDRDNTFRSQVADISVKFSYTFRF